MCGISGKVNFDRHEPVSPELLQRMTDIIAHRGPDGSGVYRRGPVGLGHRRLSIIDLITGHQPMCQRRRHRLGRLQWRDLQLSSELRRT